VTSSDIKKLDRTDRSFRPLTLFGSTGFAGKVHSGQNYNRCMARGWESKSVEAQQAEANDKSAKSGPPMSPEEAARWREKESLRLSRQRVLQQLEASQNSRHRRMLQDSLTDLEEKLSRLENISPDSGQT